MTIQRTYRALRNCPVCGENATKQLFEKQGATFVQCGNDGLVFVNPQPTPDDLKHVYDQYGREYMVSPERLDATERHDVARKQFLDFRSTNRILEVGAAAGPFLNLLRTEGWDTFGVELSDPSARYARETLGLDVRTGTIHDAAFENGSFDVVAAWATLEHTPNPDEIVREIFRVLRPGGLFVMSVPHWRGITIRLIGAKYRYVCDDHLFYFDQRNLRQMLVATGFRHVQTSTRGFDFIELVQDSKGQGEQLFLPDKNESEQSVAGSILRSRERAKRKLSSPLFAPLRLGFRGLLGVLSVVGLGDALYATATK